MQRRQNAKGNGSVIKNKKKKNKGGETANADGQNAKTNTGRNGLER
jgi:hypothetical protein